MSIGSSVELMPSPRWPSALRPPPMPMSCVICGHHKTAEKPFVGTSLSNLHAYRQCADLSRLCTYLRLVPIVSFNTQHSDINVMKAPLMCCLMGGVEFIIKKSHTFTCMETDRLRFPDTINFNYCGFNYSQYLAAYSVTEKKSVFSYKLLDCLDTLDYPRPPPREAFCSSLKM